LQLERGIRDGMGSIDCNAGEAGGVDLRSFLCLSALLPAPGREGKQELTRNPASSASGLYFLNFGGNHQFS
jgi:hypothetical protein